jgi:hypothetical protein
MRLVSRHRGLRGTKPGHSTGSSIFYQLALVSLVASIAALAHEMSRAYEEAAPAVQTPGVEAPAADEAAPEPTQLAQPDPNSRRFTFGLSSIGRPGIFGRGTACI